MKVVETTRIDYGRLTNPDAGRECTRQDHWLVRGDGSPPVLLVTDCLLQEGSKPPGASATAIVGCDLFFRYFEDGDSTSLIRDVRIRLDTLQPYQEIESDGVLGKPATRRAIRLPRGKGVVGSPLIAIDGPATLDKETVLPEVATSAPASTASVGDPVCAADIEITAVRPVRFSQPDRRMSDDMDVDAGRILEDRGTLDEVGGKAMIFGLAESPPLGLQPLSDASPQLPAVCLGLNGFVGEFLVFVGSFGAAPIIAVATIIVMVLWSSCSRGITTSESTAPQFTWMVNMTAT